MTKKGKGYAYWRQTMHMYAQGQYKFGTGQKPGSKKWKAVLLKIDACPRHNKNGMDLLGRTITCNCG